MSESQQRRNAVAARLDEFKIDALLVTGRANVRYLTGYTGSNGRLLILPEEAVFFTDPRYEIQSEMEVDCRRIVAKGALEKAVAKLIKQLKIKRVGFESSHLTFASHHLLKDSLHGVTLRPVSTIVEEQRMTKSPGEIELIRRSVQTNSEAFGRTVPRIRAGMTESEIAAELDFQMRRLGAEGPAFETIVASGAKTALPHARPADQEVNANALLLIDMGATVEGYTSDMTRMATMGRSSREIRRLYGAVLEAQHAALAAVRHGVRAGNVDRAARETLKRHKLDGAFVHSTGHGLGLEIHESPRLGKGEKTRLMAGMVVTIEPGAYIEGVGGVRIEDTVLVTRNGCQVLTPTSKELVSL